MMAAETQASRDAKKRRTGFVAVLGQTNVGKSTFLNAAMRQKLLITSSKPQTTRNRIRCVLTTDEAQIVFVDTPGLHKPGDSLSRHILREAKRGLRGMDLLVYMVEPWGAIPKLDQLVFDEWEDLDVPIILLVNKIDSVKANEVAETLIAYEKTGLFADLIPVSAMKYQGIDDVIETITKYLSPGMTLFPDDGIVEIKAEIIVERESQKGILIGKGGKMIKKIGSLARTDIEKLLGHRVFLETIVKVRANWTNDSDQIQQLTQSTR